MTITARFYLGQILATPGPSKPWKRAARRPLSSWTGMPQENWGTVCPKDALLNDEALKSGDRIISSYSTLKGVKLWIITEATDDNGHRAATTILLPSEY